MSKASAEKVFRFVFIVVIFFFQPQPGSASKSSSSKSSSNLSSSSSSSDELDVSTSFSVPPRHQGGGRFFFHAHCFFHQALYFLRQTLFFYFYFHFPLSSTSSSSSSNSIFLNGGCHSITCFQPRPHPLCVSTSQSKSRSSRKNSLLVVHGRTAADELTTLSACCCWCR